jgi:TRAP-type C4-dicarboxylate transport system permease small subunit
MGTTVLYDRHEHLIMDFFVTKLSKGKRIKLEIFINLIFLCFNFVLVYYGIKVVGIRRGIPFGTWELSTAYAYAALPAAGLIMIYLCINKLRHYMKGEFYE